MESIDINLKNCHGISELKTQEISFKKKKSCLIYASNGTMKTSFANTFKNLCNNDKEALKNQITNKKAETIIKIRESNSINENMKTLKTNKDFKENFYVIESLPEDYNFNHVSKLLINNELKNRYENVYDEINKLEKELIKKLNKNSGIKKEDIKEIICKDFNNSNFLECLLNMNNKIKKDQYNKLDEIKYNEIFNKDTVKIINDPIIMDKIISFSNHYTDLINQSPILNDNFTHNTLKKLSKDLTKNGFFDINHYIILNDKNKNSNNNQTRFYTENEMIKSEDEILKIVEEELSKINENETIKNDFNEIDKVLDKNNNSKKFREIIRDNVFLIKELEKENELKKKLWINYLSNNLDEYKELINTYENGKKEIKNIINEAKKEQKDWKRVVDIFNNRFITFPFTLSIENQEDIILKEIETPNIKFLPKTNKEFKKTHKEILDFISSGEKRAIYLLNVLFNIEILEKEFNSNSDTKQKLLIFDDIADSFDYQNKYAIIEYLGDISEKEAFNVMILTHNYDFFRTVKQRIELNTYIAYKDSKKIIFKPFKISQNPFKDWRNTLNNKNLEDNERVFLASIPFVRNLLELNGLEKEYTELTDLLHFKKEKTTKKTTKDIKEIYKKVNINFKCNKEKSIYTMFKEHSKRIVTENGFKLENKIILSIFIRLMAEEIIIKKIELNLEEIGTNQTRKLIKIFKKEFEDEDNYIEIFERVGLITSEYIHLNSFMYEPLIDINDDYLKKLYHDLDKMN